MVSRLKALVARLVYPWDESVVPTPRNFGNTWASFGEHPVVMGAEQGLGGVGSSSPRAKEALCHYEVARIRGTPKRKQSGEDRREHPQEGGSFVESDFATTVTTFRTSADDVISADGMGASLISKFNSIGASRILTYSAVRKIPRGDMRSCLS